MRRCTDCRIFDQCMYFSIKQCVLRERRKQAAAGYSSSGNILKKSDANNLKRKAEIKEVNINSIFAVRQMIVFLK